MNKKTDPYNSNDFVIIIPTKDRPEKIQNILNSLLRQSVLPGRILIVDGGKSIKDIVLSYKKTLPVEYYQCHPPGQIRQRNLALSKLKKSDSLIIYFDDDIVLEDNALMEMLDFWNSVEPETAGVSFNITNNPPYKHTLIKSLFGMSTKDQGQVSFSGYNTALFPAGKDLDTKWLCGGATVWRQDILKNNRYDEINSRWAICEDLIFSYPIGKKYPLRVCSKAKVRHEHVYDHTVKKKNVYYGYTVTLWRLYFVQCHSEFSFISFYWMITGQILFRIFTGLILLRNENLEYAYGQIKAVVRSIHIKIKNKNLLEYLNEYQA